MDLTHYFNPVDFFAFKNGDQEFDRFSLGFAIEQNTGNINNSDSFDVAIVGVPYESGNTEAYEKTEAPNKIREKLFQLSNLDKELKIVDFGNIKPGRSKKEYILALRDISEYLVEMNATVVLIGGSQEFTVSLCEVFRNEKYFSLSVVDALLDVKRGNENFGSSNFLSRIFKSNPNLFQFNLLAYQRHLFSQELFNKATGVNQHFSLGILRENINEIEPVLRNTDVLSFDLGAIKYGDAPGTKQKNPNGLRNDEACQVARYAGLSERLKVFGVYNTKNDDTDGITARLTAEIIWYFLDGILNRKEEPEWSADNKVMYKVAINEIDNPIVFYREPDTNRWWIEINSETGEHKIVACSENEYRKASNNEIPDLWLNYIQKMDELSK